MQKTFSKKNKAKNVKNTFCKIPIKARYSLKDGILTRERVEYADIPTEQIVQLFARKLGIDLGDHTGNNS